MWRLPLFFYRRRFVVLGVALLLSLPALVAAGRLRLDVSPEALIPAGTEARSARDEVRDRFGLPDAAAVFASDPALFTPQRLRALREVHDAISALPEVARV